MTQGSKARMVYLPNGNEWIDYWTGEVYEGGQYIVKEAPLDICPMYVKENSVIPTTTVQNYIGEDGKQEKVLEVYIGSKEGMTSYFHYEDDGEGFDYENGKYNLYEIVIRNDEKQIEVQINKVHEGMIDQVSKPQVKCYGNKHNKKVVIL